MGNYRISRRKFLGILGGVAVVAGAWSLLDTLTLRFIIPKMIIEFFRLKLLSEEPQTVTPTVPMDNPYTEQGKSLVSIVTGTPQTEIETMVREAVDAIGGMEKIVSPGKTVVVKPAVLTYDPNCSPNPRVVAAVAKLAKEAGGTVIVAESSGGGDTANCLSRIGITSAAQAVGAEVRALPSEKEILVEVPKGLDLHEVKTYPTVHGCDVLISVPRLKRHGTTKVTISLKNMMGAIPRSEMGRFHRKNLSQCIADLNTLLKPDLSVVDATFAMTKRGPTGGEMVEMDTVLASGDPVAVDRVGAQRLQELEEKRSLSTFEAGDVGHVNAAAALGIGTNDFNQMVIIERNIP